MWHFIEDRYKKWHWTFTPIDGSSVIPLKSKESFDTKELCIEDAKKNGCTSQG
jgi:hypothetical protein